MQTQHRRSPFLCIDSAVGLRIGWQDQTFISAPAKTNTKQLCTVDQGSDLLLRDISTEYSAHQTTGILSAEITFPQFMTSSTRHRWIKHFRHLRLFTQPARHDLRAVAMYRQAGCHSTQATQSQRCIITTNGHTQLLVGSSYTCMQSFVSQNGTHQGI